MKPKLKEVYLSNGSLKGGQFTVRQPDGSYDYVDRVQRVVLTVEEYNQIITSKEECFIAYTNTNDCTSMIYNSEEPEQEYESECICDKECRGYVNVK